MLISRVPEEGGERAREEERNFQTASELFDLMARDHDFNTAGDPLTTSDLVLLYKNIDLGKQLMSNANYMKQSPNQRVESVVYDEPESESDLSECCSSERLDHLALVNQERLDLFAQSHPLTHKRPNLGLRTTTADYDRHFLFKDPYIKEQLKNLTLMSTTSDDATVLPASLLDYICCKRLEDNYNFYMDNIIRYVKNTIEQLKRISNGDYLTDRAKQKWREVEHEKEQDGDAKVLTASTSIPLHVERKQTGVTTMWDELVHSEVDLRSLAKILEKRIVVEVPKLISGSYKLFSSSVADNLVISCSRAPAPAARLDVTLQLRRAEAGHVVSNIDSIMILHSEQPTTETDGPKLLPLTYEVVEEKKEEEETPKIIELDESEQLSYRDSLLSEIDECPSRDNEEYTPSLGIEEYSSICECTKSETENMVSLCESFTAPAPRARLVRGDVVVNLATPEDMRLTIRALPSLDTTPDETTDESFFPKNKKKTSPTRVRIKSPYENKSHMLEERKRRRLLEVRERRERKKIAMNENKQNKLCKSAIAPQASSSVTKLSITNKSFYNSIFGQNLNEKQLMNSKGRKGKKEDVIPETVSEQSEGDDGESLGTDRGKKFVNRSYYLDDAVTEMMFLQLKGDGVRASASTSAVSNDSAANPGSLSQLSNSSLANLERASPLRKPGSNDKPSPGKHRPKELASQTSLQIVPSNSPKDSPGEPAVECRRSIDKIYELMKKLGAIEPRRRGRSSGDAADADGSDSGTSLKHRLNSSNPSSFSFEKPINDGFPKDELSKQERAVIPKVIISSKQQPKPAEKGRRPTSPRKPLPDNPLKAISQLLHEFDHVQKTRQKTADARSGKNHAGPTDVKVLRQEVQSGRRRVDREGREGRVSPRRREAAAAAVEADEAREARGEAVRGPGLSSRLQALAQPRRPYVQRAGDARNLRAQVPERAARAPPPRPRSRRAEPAPPPPRPALAPIVAERSSRGRRPDAGGPECRAPAAPPPPNALKKKMVAVESYVKQHYGRGAGAGGAGAGRAGGAGVGATHTARAPLLPSDFEICSSMTSSPTPEESSQLGSRLHDMIDNMLRAPPAPPAPPAPRPGPRKPQDRPREPAHSTTELALLENALSDKTSAGAFSKRLRLKNLTLTPKHSARIVLLQSGDAASLFLGSQTLKSDTLSTSAQDLDFKALTLSATRLDWRFSRMPMQISTVGYAFPTYERSPKPKLVHVDAMASQKVLRSDGDSLFDVDTKDQTCQCYKGSGSSQGLECAVQAGAPDLGPEPESFGAESLSHTTPTSPETTSIDPYLQHPEIEKIVDEGQPIAKLDVCQAENTKDEIEDSGNVVEGMSEILDYTTSLDMLVGLLNEIQKITSNPCESEEKVTMRSGLSTDDRTSSGVVPLESDYTGVCINKMDASTSKTEELSGQVERVSKGVSAHFPPESVSVSTDVPSRARLHESFNETTLVPVNRSSSCVSFSEYKTCSELSIDVRHISDLPLAPTPGYVKSLVIFHDAHAAKIKDTGASLMCNSIVKKPPVRRGKTSVTNEVARVEVVRSRGQRKNVTKCCLNAADVDPMMRMKRDILVTVYSVLVLTVFAALSLPDMMLS